MAVRSLPPVSADPRIRRFDQIAWIYGLLFQAQRRAFRQKWRRILPRLALPEKARILDIGCGTGAQASVLAEQGYEVWGVDASARMIHTAGQWLRGAMAEAVRLGTADPLQGLPFSDSGFDLVYAAHVLHGLQAEQRLRFCQEAQRVSRGIVLIYDYSPRGVRGPGFVTRALEALERSDYRRFRRNGLLELRKIFATVEVVSASPGSAWYLCRSLRWRARPPRALHARRGRAPRAR